MQLFEMMICALSGTLFGFALGYVVGVNTTRKIIKEEKDAGRVRFEKVEKAEHSSP